MHVQFWFLTANHCFLCYSVTKLIRKKALYDIVKTARFMSGNWLYSFYLARRLVAARLIVGDTITSIQLVYFPAESYVASSLAVDDFTPFDAALSTNYVSVPWFASYRSSYTLDYLPPLNQECVSKSLWGNTMDGRAWRKNNKLKKKKFYVLFFEKRFLDKNTDCWTCSLTNCRPKQICAGWMETPAADGPLPTPIGIGFWSAWHLET